MSKVVVECMSGLGDNVYNRAVVKTLLAEGHDVYCRTAWPQVYVDLPVKCVPAVTQLRTHARNISRYNNWAEYPQGATKLHPHYNWSTRDPIPTAMAKSIKLNPNRDFAFRPPWQLTTTRPTAVVVPPTIRSEWPNYARPCDPKYMQELIDHNQGFDWIELSDTVEGHEWFAGAPLTGVRRVNVSTEGLIGLLAGADVIVTSPGYALPLGIALRVPTLCLFGGDIPARYLVEDWMLGAMFRAVEPRPFCECGYRHRHTAGECSKVLKGVQEAFQEVAFKWKDDYGFWPVNINGQYNQGYFDHYKELEETELGVKITQFRVDWVNRHFGNRRLVDVGVGSGQFVRASGALGCDINPASVEMLKRLGRFIDLEQLAKTEVLTFWDSLEHLPNPSQLLARAEVGVAVSLPIFRSRATALASKHFKPDEHIHYWTHYSFIEYMERQGFKYINHCDAESGMGREDIITYAFGRT